MKAHFHEVFHLTGKQSLLSESLRAGVWSAAWAEQRLAQALHGNALLPKLALGRASGKQGHEVSWKNFWTRALRKNFWLARALGTVLGKSL